MTVHSNENFRLEKIKKNKTKWGSIHHLMLILCYSPPNQRFHKLTGRRAQPSSVKWYHKLEWTCRNTNPLNPRTIATLKMHHGMSFDYRQLKKQNNYFKPCTITCYGQSDLICCTLLMKTKTLMKTKKLIFFFSGIIFARKTNICQVCISITFRGSHCPVFLKLTYIKQHAKDCQISVPSHSCFYYFYFVK